MSRVVRRWIAGVVGLVLAGIASGQGAPPATVRLDEVREERLMSPRGVTGEIVTLRRSLIASQVAGFVVELIPLEGDAVERGAVIARLDDEVSRHEVTRAGAVLDSARGLVAQREAELTRFARDLERVRTLHERGSTTVSALDAAEADVGTTEALLMQARAQVLSAEAGLARARRELADKTIRAPFDGRVVRKITEVGEWVTPGDTIVEIVSLSELEARIDVPEHLVGFLVEDVGSIPVRVPGLGTAGEVEATVIGMIPQADPLSRMFRVRLAVTGAGDRLRPGMSLTAFVPTGAFESTLTVHKDALLRDDAGEFVFMAVPFRSETNPAVNGQAIPVRVDRRFAAGDRVAIRPGGLRAGSMVLVEGNERVFPTQALIVQGAPAGSPFAGGGEGGGG
jgi:RND family efflux transporter MFP subunit